MQIVPPEAALRPRHCTSSPAAESFARNPSADCKIVVAGDAKRIETVDGGNAFRRLGIVADNIAETDDAIGPSNRNVVNYGLQGRQVGVNVGDKRAFHDPLFTRCRSGPIRARSRETVRQAAGDCFHETFIRRWIIDRPSAGPPATSPRPHSRRA